jgi:hypothetical protein
MNVTQLMDGFSGDCLKPVETIQLRTPNLKASPAGCLEVGKTYITRENRLDDEGNPFQTMDFVHCFLDTIPGEKATKQFKLLRFLVSGRTKRFSEVPGVTFFGPVEVEQE